MGETPKEGRMIGKCSVAGSNMSWTVENCYVGQPDVGGIRKGEMCYAITMWSAENGHLPLVLVITLITEAQVDRVHTGEWQGHFIVLLMWALEKTISKYTTS